VALIGTYTANLFIDFSVLWIAIGRALSPAMLRNAILPSDGSTEPDAGTPAVERV
jgi:hypothetical protein